MSTATHLRLYHFEPRVTALGPGLRAGVWLQGCSLGCPGCLVPDAQAPAGGDLVSVGELTARIASIDNIEGVTVSGGEPFEQKAALSPMLRGLRERRPELSLMIFSGHRRETLERDPVCRGILSMADVLIDGPFLRERRHADGWRGSANQRIHYLSARYGPRDHEAAPANALEFLVRRNGAFFMAGIPAPGVWEAVVERLERKREG
jgi:anaerobic ribonucleoside-triphosphate reductase activating protein